MSCKKDKGAGKIKNGEGIVINYTAMLDGCTFLIRLDDGTTLEPITIPEGTTLIHNRRVAVTYKEKPAMSVCMAGTTANILTLVYK